MNMIESMNNYSRATSEETFGEILIDFLDKFLQWLEEMANTKPKYYNIVMIENVEYIIQRLDKSNIWKQKHVKLNQLYDDNVEKYMKYIFEYQFPKYAEYMKEVRKLIEGNESLEEKSKYNEKAFNSMVSSTFGNLAKNCKSMNERIKKHLKSSDALKNDMYNKLKDYIKKEYEDVESIAEKHYPNLSLSPGKEEVERELE